MAEFVDPLLVQSFDGLWPETLIDIVRNDQSSGNVNRVAVYTGLAARRTQKEITESVDPFAGIARKVIDVYYISYLDGVIPEISEDQYVRLGGVDHKIISMTDQGAQVATIEVVTERAR
jgi:hypothetical protein